MKKILGVISALVLVLGLALPVLAQDPSISPASVEATILPGGEFVVEKTIQTPQIPPKADILFLADTTGSMGEAIDNVKANATAILNDIVAIAPDAQFGVADYKDYPWDSYVVQFAQQMTSNTALVQSAINNWTAGGGADGSEGWFMALDRSANAIAPAGNPGWRADSTKIVVIFGDAPAHDPVPTIFTGLAYAVTETTVTADLIADNIRVIAVSVLTGYYGAGLDDDPTNSADDYPIPWLGTPGQATRIAAATGGAHLIAPSPDDVTDAIMAGLTNLDITVSMTSDAAYPLSTSFSPVEQVVKSGSIVKFIETVTVASDALLGTYNAKDWVLIDGQPMVDASGAIIYETKTIHVPEGGIPPEPEVGGDIYPANKLLILTPWLVLAIVLAVGATILIRRRQHQS